MSNQVRCYVARKISVKPTPFSLDPDLGEGGNQLCPAPSDWPSELLSWFPWCENIEGLPGI